jgi:transcriptional regulator with XRE-family HTH domain
MDFDPIGFAQRLRQSREAAFMTQQALSAKIAVDKSTVIAWERGTKGGKPLGAPDAKNVVKLAEALNRDAHWLLTGDGGINQGEASFEDAIKTVFDIAEARMGRRPTGFSLTYPA